MSIFFLVFLFPISAIYYYALKTAEKINSKEDLLLLSAHMLWSEMPILTQPVNRYRFRPLRFIS